MFIVKLLPCELANIQVLSQQVFLTHNSSIIGIEPLDNYALQMKTYISDTYIYIKHANVTWKNKTNYVHKRK